MHCSNCGNDIPNGSSFCPHCGSNLLTNSSNNQAQNSFNNQVNSNYQSNNVSNKKSGSAMSIVAFICGLLSILFMCFPIVSLILGIAAIVLTCFNKNRSGLGIAGMILGILGTIIAIIIEVVFLAGKSWFNNNKGLIEEAINEGLEQGYNVVINKSLEDENNPEFAKKLKDNISNQLRGMWKGEEGSWEFNSLYALDYLDSTGNSYIYGPYEVLSLKEGCKLLGLSEDRVDQMYSNNPRANQYENFSFAVTPKLYVSNGVEQDLSNIVNQGVYLCSLYKDDNGKYYVEIISGNSGISRTYVQTTTEPSEQFNKIKDSPKGIIKITDVDFGNYSDYSSSNSNNTNNSSYSQNEVKEGANETKISSNSNTTNPNLANSNNTNQESESKNTSASNISTSSKAGITFNGIEISIGKKFGDIKDKFAKKIERATWEKQFGSLFDGVCYRFENSEGSGYLTVFTDTNDVICAIYFDSAFGDKSDVIKMNVLPTNDYSASNIKRILGKPISEIEELDYSDFKYKIDNINYLIYISHAKSTSYDDGVFTVETDKSINDLSMFLISDSNYADLLKEYLRL